MWTITDPTQLPANVRVVAFYDYLNKEFLEMWLEGLEVAHRLTEQHAEQHGNATYYQDTFGAHYIAALANPRLEGDIVFDEMAEPTHAHLHRNDQPSWQAFKLATERLKTEPRGSIALLGAEDRWHIRIHCGGGYVSDCKTMRSRGPKPSAREIHECLLSTESYLAKHQARKEREILSNFAAMRELKLQPGQRIRNVRAVFNGKTRSMTFTVKSISETGYVSLGDGTLAGSGQRFTHSVPACEITAEQLQAPKTKKAVTVVDPDTAVLF